jgi:hypothetical protein
MPIWLFFLNYARLGEGDKAAFDLIATNPDFDLLRNDPRFLSILDRRGLTPYNRRKAR